MIEFFLWTFVYFTPEKLCLAPAGITPRCAELAALVQETCFYHLEKPVRRVTGWDTPYPHAQEWDYFPGPKRIGDALRKVMEV